MGFYCSSYLMDVPLVPRGDITLINYEETVANMTLFILPRDLRGVTQQRHGVL